MTDQLTTPSSDVDAWRAWQSMAATAEPTLDDLRIIALSLGKTVAPGTPAEHTAYVHEMDGQPFAKIARLYRQRAIFGIWADGSERGPKLPAMTQDKRNLLHDQMRFQKYLRWVRRRNPEAYTKFTEGRPGFIPRKAVVKPGAA